MSDTTSWEWVDGYDNTTYSDDSIFTVDSRTKKIQTITDQTLVAGEDCSQLIMFEMDRYYDAVDLSEKHLQIIFQAENGYTDINSAVCVKRSDDKLCFGWVVPGEALTEPGTLAFSIEAVGSNYVWKTRTYEKTIEDGLNGEIIIPEPTDRAWYIEIQSQVATAVENAEAALTKAEAIINGIGNPTVAATAAAMTDTTKVYVYTGSETGYTYGNWYYYDGTEWVSGGTYVSTALYTNSTPTQGSDNAVRSGGVYDVTADLDARVEDLEQGGTGGLSVTAVNLLNTILTEAVYGSDQTANIALLKKELSNIPPVSISAVLDGTALAGQAYSELSFIVTATFDDDSTQVVDNYTVITTGTVTAGSNTVTIRYRGITTTCTFTAEQVTTYSITNNLTNASTSNNTSVVVENDRYAAEITTTSGYDVSVFTVTMGGVDVTSTVRNGNNIVIDAVTGNVVITVTASAPVYLDPLIRRRYGFDGVAYLCPDNHVSEAIRFNNAITPMVSEYPAKYDCTITYRIENNTEESVSVNSLGFALLSGSDDVWVTKNEYPYYSALTIPVGGNLAPGEYLEGTYLWRAGYQLVCTTTLTNIGKLDIKLRGNYVPIEYDKDDTYDRYVYNASTPYVSHTYANEIVWYADDGTTELKKGKNTKLFTITDQLTAGMYDVVFRLVNNDTENHNMAPTLFAVGTIPVADASVTSVFNSFYTGRSNVENTWIYRTVTVASGNTILVPTDISDLGTDNGYVEFYFKEVNA